ncbi:MAG TPA: Clp protease ClpP, partial [Bacillota bacterium]|nr:Clp protease ClpP [Bacillota bacterium]
RLRDYMFRTGELVRDVGTVLVGREAVEAGLVNAVGGLSDAIAKLNELCGRKSAQQGFFADQFNYQPQRMRPPEYGPRPGVPQPVPPQFNPNPGGLYS